MKWLALLLCLASSGCASYWNNSARSATTGAVSGLDTPSVKKQLADVASGTVAAAATQANTGVQQLAATVRQEVLGPSTSASLVQLREDLLGAGLQADAANLRETLVGQPLRDDLNAAIDGAMPHIVTPLQQGITGATLSVKSDVDQELPKLERALYLTLSVIGGAIVLVLLVTGLLVHEVRKSRRHASS